MKKLCSSCPMRAKFDEKPKSFIGKIWRWHINFCPGWKGYVASLNEDERKALNEKYNLNK